MSFWWRTCSHSNPLYLAASHPFDTDSATWAGGSIALVLAGDGITYAAVELAVD